MSILGAAAIGAGASILGNIIGTGNQHSQNDYNAEQAQLNREFQEQMWNKQVAYNKEMWNAQNAYNSPDNQVSRLRAAGLNPALALGQVASGQASSSAQGVGTPSGATASSPGLYRPDFSGILDAMLSSRQVNEQVKGMQLDNAYKRASFQIRLAEDMARARKTLGDAKISEINANWQDQLNWSDFNLSFAQQQTENAQAENLIAQTMILKEQLNFLPEKYRLEIANLSAQVAFTASQKALTDAQIKTEFNRAFDLNQSGHSKRVRREIIEQHSDEITDIIQNYAFSLSREKHYTGLMGSAANSFFNLRGKAKGKTRTYDRSGNYTEEYY